MTSLCSRELHHRGESAGVQFPDDGPDLPILTPTHRIVFYQNDRPVLQGYVGLMQPFWGKNGVIIFYPSAVEVGERLFTLETNKHERKLNPTVDSYFFCYFNRATNSHHNVGYQIRKLHSHHLFCLVLRHLKRLGIVRQTATMQIHNLFSDVPQPLTAPMVSVNPNFLGKLLSTKQNLPQTTPYKQRVSVITHSGMKETGKVAKPVERQMIQPVMPVRNKRKLWPGTFGLQLPTIMEEEDEVEVIGEKRRRPASESMEPTVDSCLRNRLWKRARTS